MLNNLKSAYEEVSSVPEQLEILRVSNKWLGKDKTEEMRGLVNGMETFLAKIHHHLDINEKHQHIEGNERN